MASLIVPSVGATTVNEAALTSIPSYFSSWSGAPVGFVSAAVKAIGAGKVFPLESNVIPVTLEISVCGGLFGSVEGLNSATVPATWTSLPTATEAGGAVLVKMKIPSDEFGSLS